MPFLAEISVLAGHVKMSDGGLGRHAATRLAAGCCSRWLRRLEQPPGGEQGGRHGFGRPAAAAEGLETRWERRGGTNGKAVPCHGGAGRLEARATRAGAGVSDVKVLRRPRKRSKTLVKRLKDSRNLVGVKIVDSEEQLLQGALLVRLQDTAPAVRRLALDALGRLMHLKLLWWPQQLLRALADPAVEVRLLALDLVGACLEAGASKSAYKQA